MQPFCHKVAFTKTKKFLALAKQYTQSIHLIGEAWEVYQLYREDCKKATNHSEVNLKAYIDRLTDLLEKAKENGENMRVKDRRLVMDIIELLRHDAESHMFTYVKGDKDVR